MTATCSAPWLPIWRLGEGVSRVPRAFAATILHDYARAVAARHSVEGAWSAFVAIQDNELHGPIWVTNADSSDVYHYADVNVTPEGNALIPAVAPTSVLASCIDPDTGLAYTVRYLALLLGLGAVAHDRYRARRGVGAPIGDGVTVADGWLSTASAA